MEVLLSQFIRALVASGLMTSEEIEAFNRNLPPEKKPRDGKALAQALVRRGKLTKFQAQAVYQGKTKGLILDNYVVLDRIGQGGMGQVYRAKHKVMERVVALKTLPGAATESERAVQRFHREVKVAARLSHPNIVTAHDAREDHGIHFLVMEYVEGQDLSTLVKKQGRLPVKTGINYILQAAKGLEYAHSHNVIHRDIKPSNLILDPEGTVKILDMGLARLNEMVGPTDSTAEETLTGSSEAMGTINYMPPEQAENAKNVDHRADIYSLGCTLFSLLTAKSLYSGTTTVEILLAHREAPIPTLCDKVPDAPQNLEAVFQKMVAKKPEDRYSTMTEVIEALEQCDQSDPEQVPEDSLSNRSSLTQATTATEPIPDCDETATEESLPLDLPVIAPVDGMLYRKPKMTQPLLIGFGICLSILALLLLAFYLGSGTPDGTLVVGLDESGATVQVADNDGEVVLEQTGEKGKMPFYIEPGDYRLEVSKIGFQPFHRTFTIASKEEKEIWARLKPIVQANMDEEIEAGSTESDSIEQPDETPLVGVAPDEKPVALPEDADRQLAEYFLNRGKVVFVHLKDEPPKWYRDRLGYVRPDGEIGSVEDLPNTSFILYGLRLNATTLEDIRQLASCSRLECLFITELEEVALEELRFPNGLKYIAAQSSGIGDEVLAALSDANHLLELIVSGSRVTNEGLAHISQLKGIEKLAVYNTQVSDEGLVHLAGMSNLKSLILGSTQTSAQGLAHLAGCRNLEYLQFNHFSPNPGFDSLEVMRNVRFLDLEYSPITDECLEYLYGLDRLEILNVHNTAVTSTGIAKLKEALPNCEVICEFDVQPGDMSETPAGPPSDAYMPFDANKAKWYQQKWADYLGVPVEFENSIGMKMVLIPPGQFMMGATKAQAEDMLKGGLKHKSWAVSVVGSAQPQHRVVVTQPFYLSAYELTLGHFNAFVDAEGYITEAESSGKGGTGIEIRNEGVEFKQGPDFNWKNIGIEQMGDYPVGNVTWNDAVEFCNWLGKKDGQKYSLPTEAQWEFACRAGSESTWHFGDDKSKLQDYDWIGPWCDRKPKRVGQMLPNGFGIYDLYGNVGEWCLDWHTNGFYGSSPTNDPSVTSPDTWPSNSREVRGGNYSSINLDYDGVYFSSSWLRGVCTEPTCYNGFRPVMLIDPKNPPRVISRPPNESTKFESTAAPPLAAANDPDRRVAEWVLGMGGCVYLHGKGKQSDLSDLPEGTFVVHQIDIKGNKSVDDASLQNLRELSQLEILTLEGCSITDAGLQTIGKMSRLQSLNVSGAALSDAGLSHLRQLTSLKSLFIPSTSISRDGLKHVADFPRLKVLDVFGIPVGEIGMEALSNINTLAALNIGGTDSSGLGLTRLGELPNLRCLGISRAPLDDSDIKELCSLKGLELLCLWETQITEKGLALLRASLPGCEILTTEKAWHDEYWKVLSPRLPTPHPPLAVAPFTPEQAKQHQKAWADHLGIQIEFENSIGMKMVLIPPGEFMMGGTEEQAEEILSIVREKGPTWLINGVPHSLPQHKVRITRPYYLAAHEVTQRAFSAFVNATNYATEAEVNGQGGIGVVRVVNGELQKGRSPEFAWNSVGIEPTDEHPVNNVTWNDSVAFCEWLSRKEELKYALPTEAQWEFACRAGSTTQWHFGDDKSKLADYDWLLPWSEDKIQPVGQKLPNGFGAYDLYGNVNEWCLDWKEYYTCSAICDPAGPERGIGNTDDPPNRAIRGSGHSKKCGDGQCTSWIRAANPPETFTFYLGFRPVMLIDPNNPPKIPPKPAANSTKPDPTPDPNPKSEMQAEEDEADKPPKISWKLRHTLEGHMDEVFSVAFHPKGQMVVSGSLDGTIRFWDVRAGKQLRFIQGLRNVFDLAISPNGALVAAVGGSIKGSKIWNAMLGQAVNTPGLVLCQVLILG